MECEVGVTGCTGELNAGFGGGPAGLKAGTGGRLVGLEIGAGGGPAGARKACSGGVTIAGPWRKELRSPGGSTGGPREGRGGCSAHAGA